MLYARPLGSSRKTLEAPKTLQFGQENSISLASLPEIEMNLVLFKRFSVVQSVNVNAMHVHAFMFVFIHFINRTNCFDAFILCQRLLNLKTKWKKNIHTSSSLRRCTLGINRSLSTSTVNGGCHV